MKGKSWLFAIGVVVGFGLIIWLGMAWLRPYTFHGTVMQSPNAAPEFTLMSNTGQRVRLSDFRGRLVLLYFGYTFCPDVCPATLAEIAKAMEILGEEADRVQVIMITVDPERDSPEKLGEYVAHFDSRFLGATGTLEEIAQVATLYGIFFEKNEGTEATGYLVDHTATQMVIDQEGYLKLIFPFGTPGEDIAADLAYILK